MRFVMDQAGLAIYDIDKMDSFFIGGTRNGVTTRAQIRARNANGSSAGMMGEYRNADVARYVLDMFLMACEHDETFRFPSEAELEHATIHRSHVTSRKVSHGGS